MKLDNYFDARDEITELIELTQAKLDYISKLLDTSMYISNKSDSEDTLPNASSFILTTIDEITEMSVQLLSKVERLNYVTKELRNCLFDEFHSKFVDDKVNE